MILVARGSIDLCSFPNDAREEVDSGLRPKTAKDATSQLTIGVEARLGYKRSHVSLLRLLELVLSALNWL